jgi:hypothetical protein
MLPLLLWLLVGLLLMLGTFAEGADKCALDKFRLRSTGDCVAKDGALGRRYYRGGRARHRVERPRRRRPPVPEPDSATEPGWPPPRELPLPPARDPLPGFADRFHFDSGSYKGDRER